MAVKASATITLSFMVDVKAVYRYYKLQASTASAPSAPTTTPASTPSGWTDVEPTYTEGSSNTLYFVDGTLFANNTFSYSAVSKSSSYEAAKTAYNKAVSAKDAVDNLETRVTTAESKITEDAIINTVKESSQFQVAGDYVTGTAEYSQLKQTVSGINSTVQSHSGSISTLQQTAAGIQVRLENQQTVKNLVSNSRMLNGWGYGVSAGVTMSKNVSTSAPEFGEVTIARFNASTANSSDLASYIHMTDTVRVTSGSKYTLSVWARKVSGGNARPALSLSTTNQSKIVEENLTSKWKRYSYTFTLGTISDSSKYVDITTVFGVCVLAGQTGVFEVCCPQLEAGNTMNPWSASSTDSTDYMNFTSRGLVIGDMTEEKLGRNVCINDGGVHVFYEGSIEGVNEIAHFGYGEFTGLDDKIVKIPYYTFGSRSHKNNPGNYSIVQGTKCMAEGNSSSATGIETVALGNGSHAEGYKTSSGDATKAVSGTRSYNYTHAEGAETTAMGYAAHAEGDSCSATEDSAHAEGKGSTASGKYSHAEGSGTTASSSASHSEGYGTTASGVQSHSEGRNTTASGGVSHAQGSGTEAKGFASHASGLNTVAASDYQTVIGRNNVSDPGTGTVQPGSGQVGEGRYAFIVGNGESSSTRSNAFSVDWEGNMTASGTVSGANMTSSGNISGTDITASGTLSGANMTSSGTVSGTNITASGTVSGANMTSSGNISGTNITASGDISGTNMTASGTVSGANVNASGTVSGAKMTSSGDISGTNMTASGTVSGANVNASGNITSGNMCYVSHGKANTDAMMQASRTDTGRSVSFGVGSGGSNAGVYDNNKGKWLLYSDTNKTYLNGNAVTVDWDGNVNLNPYGKTFKPYYVNETTAATRLFTAGYVTSSKTQVVFTIPIERYCTYQTVSISSASGGAFKLRQNGNYTHGSSSSKLVNPSSYTATHRGKYITVVAKFDNTTNAINNAPVGIEFSGNLTFS